MSKAQMTAISGDTKWRGSGMIKAGLGLILLSLVVILPARNTKAGAAEIIITDDVTLDYIAFSIPKGFPAFTGSASYTFHQCSTDFQLTGSGVESDVSGTVTLNAKAPTQSVSAGYNLGQETGKAVVYYLTSTGGSYKVFTITQRVPRPKGDFLDCETP
jgi:hypothetical protein